MSLRDLFRFKYGEGREEHKRRRAEEKRRRADERRDGRGSSEAEHTAVNRERGGARPPRDADRQPGRVRFFFSNSFFYIGVGHNPKAKTWFICPIPTCVISIGPKPAPPESDVSSIPAGALIEEWWVKNL